MQLHEVEVSTKDLLEFAEECVEQLNAEAEAATSVSAADEFF